MGVGPGVKKYKSAATFEKYVKANLSAKDYENLPEYLNTSGTWFRRLMDNPANMNERQVRIIAKLLDVLPWTLCDVYGLGVFKMKLVEGMGFRQQAMESQKTFMENGVPVVITVTKV